MNGFQMLRASTVNEAVSMMQSNEDAQLIAGGQTLIPSIKHGLARPAVLVDLTKVEAIRGIGIGAKEITFGAMTTHAEVAASAEVKKVIPVLADLAGKIGDRMVRNMGTIGGSVANNDPAADYPPHCLRWEPRSKPTGGRSLPRISSLTCSQPLSNLASLLRRLPFRLVRQLHMRSSAIRHRATPWWAPLFHEPEAKCESRSPAPRASSFASQQWKKHCASPLRPKPRMPS